MSASEIHELAAKLISAAAPESTTIYLLNPIGNVPTHEQVARIGGNPIGVTEERWPLFEGRPMEHLITIDLEAMPELRKDGLAEARAIALFISDPVENQAFEPGTQETAILVLSQEDIEGGELSAALCNNKIAAGGYQITPVKVPRGVFEELPEDQEHTDLEKLKNAIYAASGYAGGEPLWLQYPEHKGRFLLQFDESLVDVNLGDAGILYVFADTAFWQCH